MSCEMRDNENTFESCGDKSAPSHGLCSNNDNGVAACDHGDVMDRDNQSALLLTTQNHERRQKQHPVFHASTQLHLHDVVFHVIFGSDISGIFELVHASAIRLHSITHCPFLSKMMNTVISERNQCASLDSSAAFTRFSADLVKALFFLFMNVDMVLKEYVCNPGCKKAFAAAMNAKRLDDSGCAPSASAAAGASASSTGAASSGAQQSILHRTHAWSMMGTRPMDPAKARRFFAMLHDSIIKLWLQDERLHASDLVQMVKEEYLVC